jgi:hypothetical protein
MHYRDPRNNAVMDILMNDDEEAALYKKYSALPWFLINLYFNEKRCGDCEKLNTEKCPRLEGLEGAFVYSLPCQEFSSNMEHRIIGEAYVMKRLECNG